MSADLIYCYAITRGALDTLEHYINENDNTTLDRGYLLDLIGTTLDSTKLKVVNKEIVREGGLMEKLVERGFPSK